MLDTAVLHSVVGEQSDERQMSGELGQTPGRQFRSWSRKLTAGATERIIRNDGVSRVAEIPDGDSSVTPRSAARELSLARLAATCAEQTQKGRRGEPFDGACCVELFRRAICDRDELAWHQIVEQYRRIVVHWVRRHPTAATFGEDDDYWVNGAFVRFYQAITPDRFDQFAGLPQILRYLKLCVDSVVQDAVRATARQPVSVSIDADRDDDEGSSRRVGEISSGDTADQRTNARELWAAIERVLGNDVERRVAYLSFVLEYKPREIQALLPRQFASASAVYPVIRNVIERLQRSPDVREFLQGSASS